MSKIKEVRDMFAYMDWINDLNAANNSNNRPLFFRGHADEEWDLLPYVFRNDLYNERNLILDYKQVLYPEPNYFSKLERMLVEMQHHGIPTRLLDWSLSPLIALYFACVSHPKEDGRIFCLNPWSVRLFEQFSSRPTYHYEIMKETRLFLALGWTLEETVDYIKRKYSYDVSISQLEMPLSIVGRYMDDRVSTQQGCFVIWGYQKVDLRMFPAYRKNIQEIKIPKENKKDLIMCLKRLGISNFTVFRDFEGFSKDVKSVGSVFKL